MNKNKGFIATSLIYSFFLVFIAIMVALLNNFIANKTIQERFNDDVKHALNNERYVVTLRGTNTNIQDGVTLSNLINDSAFENGTTYWNKYNISNAGRANCGNNKNCFQSSSDGYIYQNVRVTSGNKYYYAIKYYNTTGARQNVYLDNTFNGTIFIDGSYKSSWTHASNIYESNKNGDVQMIIGNGTGLAQITEVMLINLTSSFGSGNEPTKEWIDNNIEWFDGTISYLRLNKIRSGTGINVKFSPYKKSASYNINCDPSVQSKMELSNYTADNAPSGDVRTYADFSISSITENITCKIDWK